ncbi:MAG: hypothetical protein KatS3mg105_4041 [Gemmatales bacterium]|nr:MAG: hypothetical protein KatS3mg105_4041 [Gemmatales bacterium]
MAHPNPSAVHNWRNLQSSDKTEVRQERFSFCKNVEEDTLPFVTTPCPLNFATLLRISFLRTLSGSVIPNIIAISCPNGSVAVELEELKQLIQQTDPAVVLVPARIIRRLLQAEFKVPSFLLHAPHEDCFTFERQLIFRHVEQDELELEPDRLLPARVTLLSRPSAEFLQSCSREEILLSYWRMLFHAHIHLALEDKVAKGELNAEIVRQRIERIGQTEFDEIRSVLQEENYLFPPMDDVGVYVEFAAVYLELYFFRTNLRPTYFPGLRNLDEIDRLLLQECNAQEIFEKTRLPGAPDPIIRADTSSDESHDYYWRLMRAARRASREGDLVRAAILCTKAARVAPADLSESTRNEALQKLNILTFRLQDILKFNDSEAQEWVIVLPELLDKADQGKRPVEARLLYDLQNACREHEKKLYSLDVFEWIQSLGKRPIKRQLTSVQLVRTTQHLRNAAKRLTMARVSTEDRRRLARLLRNAESLSEQRLRERFRPILQSAFQDVGLTATSPPGQVALDKMIEELLDRLTEYGFITFADLRDTLSRNQLKLADISDAYSYWRGDPLQRLDKRLSALMEGVYRRGEFYMRWLESISSLFFGTVLGRFLTLNLIIPFGGAFALVHAIRIFWNEYQSSEWQFEASPVLYGPLGLLFLGLIHVRMLRRLVAYAGTGLFQVFRFLVYDGPLMLWKLQAVRTVLQSWPAVMCRLYLLKPLVCWGILYWVWPETFGQWPTGILAFLLAATLLNSRFGRELSEAYIEAMLLLYSKLRFDFLQGLYRLVTRFFKRATEALEYVLYTVDENLRFRDDDPRIIMAIRATLGVLWFPFRYIIRLYFVLLIEPSVNPFKLPISSVVFKFMLLMPWYAKWMITFSAQNDLIARLQPRLGFGVSDLLVWAVFSPTLWLLPSAVTFFIWEMQENWRLFRANRAAGLKPVVIGKHGETLPQLLKPGFHSGTIPRLYAQLRQAEKTAYITNNWRNARTFRQALDEVARCVQLFVEREFIALLNYSRNWQRGSVKCGQVELSCNRIRVELQHADHPDEPMWLAFEQRSGWVIASISETGWLVHLSSEEADIIQTALAGLYKIAGVDLVREQVVAALPVDAPTYDFTEKHLLVWTEEKKGEPFRYNLRANDFLLRPQPMNGATRNLPPLDARRLCFSRFPLTWQQWENYWANNSPGTSNDRIWHHDFPAVLIPRANGEARYLS